MSARLPDKRFLGRYRMAGPNSKRARAERKAAEEYAAHRNTLLENHKEQCPACAAFQTATIYYGHWFTDTETLQDIENNLVVLKEFSTNENDPSLHCINCRHEWSKP
jgi:hypothetical protein